MSWNSANERGEYEQRQRSFLQLSREEQDKITEQDAGDYVLPDTLALALWVGYLRRAKEQGGTVADALREYCRHQMKGRG